MIGRAVLVIALLGSLVGIGSAVQALIEVGNQPPYTDRLAFGILALVMAVDEIVLPLALRSRPRIAALLMLLSAVVGGVAINFFYINTFYVLAVPFWLAAAFAAAVTPSASAMEPPSPPPSSGQ
jgi:hypothetical protein